MRHNFSLADQHATTQTRPAGLPLALRAIIPDGQTMRVSFAMMDAMQHDFSKGTAMNDIGLMDAETMILDAAPAADRPQLVTLLAQGNSGNRAIARSTTSTAWSVATRDALSVQSTKPRKRPGTLPSTVCPGRSRVSTRRTHCR